MLTKYYVKYLGRVVPVYIGSDYQIWGFAHEIYSISMIKRYEARNQVVPRGQVTLASQPNSYKWFIKHAIPDSRNNNALRILKYTSSDKVFKKR